MKINIAIDGPSAAGKSTIANIIANKYSYCHLDTGAMYRLVAYKALENNLAFDDEKSIVAMIEKSEIKMFADGRVFLDGNLITDEIRTNEISMAASLISKLSKVRDALVRMQREIVKEKGYVVDGRDIGSVVLKDAEVKFYLTASVKSRALRRYKQNEELNIPNKDLDLIIEEIIQRDNQDMNRKHSPLIRCDDAILIDSSNLSIDETVSLMSEYIDEQIRR